MPKRLILKVTVKRTKKKIIVRLLCLSLEAAKRLFLDNFNVMFRS